MADNTNEFNPKEFAKAHAKASNSLKDYNETLETIKANLNILKQLRGDLASITEDEQIVQKRINDLTRGLTSEQKEEYRLNNKNYRNLLDQSKVNKQAIRDTKKQIKEISNVNDGLKKTVKLSSAISASLLSGARNLKKMGKDALKLNGMWGDAMKWQKSIQKTEQSMGVLSSQSSAFRSNMSKAAGKTNQMGVDAGQLAKMQGSYSESLGRSVQLSQKGLVAMSQLSSGAMLGSEGAAQMASNMDEFGVSVVGASDRVDEMLNTAHKMGVNSIKVTKNLQKNMKMANKYHFKGGVRGMTKLATEAARLNLDMDSIATLADKVFRPEGAVEVASKLQTMGGEFAKLGDPFQLMFKARNDFAGFTKDIGNATKEFVQFNEESGEFDVSGHALDRVKEISNITGMNSEKLVEMGRRAKRLDTIESETNLDEENSKFISSLAKFNENTKEWEVTIGNSERNIKNLNDLEVDKLKNEKATLKERAEQAQTFDESWNNLKNTLKTMLLPLLDGLSEGLKKPIQTFSDWVNKSGGFEMMFNAAKSVGDSINGAIEFMMPYVESLLKFVEENPVNSVIGAISGIGLFKAAQWAANGVSLGLGFNSVASAGGGGGIGRRGKMNMSGKVGKRIGNALGGRDNPIGRGFRNIGAKQLKRGGKVGMLGKLGKGIARGGLAGVAGGLASMGMNTWRGSLEEPEGGMGKALGVGSKALDWGATGAMLGSVIPGVGTLAGGLIGGLAGAGKGVYDEWFSEPKDSYDDVIIRSGQAPIGISKDDDILAAKEGGAVDKALDKSSGDNNRKDNINIKFSPINIKGKIELTGDGVSGNLDLDDPIFTRDLSRIVQEEVRKAVGGGKINPNPI